MNRHNVLFVDDEANILNALRRLLQREDYRVITAASGQEGLKILEETPVQVVISDQRMPEMSGTEFMTHVMRRYPDVVRVILSGYADVSAIADAVNNGHIYKFLLKPWNDDVLKMEIDGALRHYELVNLNRSLHQRVLEQNEELKRYTESLEQMIRSRTAELEKQNKVLAFSREILENIPVPVLGVGEDGHIVLINGPAAGLSFDGQSPVVGRHLADYLPGNLTAVFSRSLEDKTSLRVRNCVVGGDVFDINFTPLSGKESREGVILLLQRSTAGRQEDEV